MNLRLFSDQSKGNVVTFNELLIYRNTINKQDKTVPGIKYISMDTNNSRQSVSEVCISRYGTSHNLILIYFLLYHTILSTLCFMVERIYSNTIMCFSCCVRNRYFSCNSIKTKHSKGIQNYIFCTESAHHFSIK